MYYTVLTSGIEVSIYCQFSDPGSGSNFTSSVLVSTSVWGASPVAFYNHNNTNHSHTVSHAALLHVHTVSTLVQSNLLTTALFTMKDSSSLHTSVWEHYQGWCCEVVWLYTTVWEHYQGWYCEEVWLYTSVWEHYVPRVMLWSGLTVY